MTNEDKAREEGCYFDHKQADRAVKFIETYCVPAVIGKPIQLLDWQKRVVRQLFGERRPDGRMRYRRATLSMAKKNGKTVLLSAILLYGMLGGITPQPFCTSASTSRENAGQVYRELKSSFDANPKLAKLSKCLDSYKRIECKSKNARYLAMSADAGASEGENISLCVVDETHAHVSDRLYRSLEYSTIARPDSLFVNISTSGHDQGHFWYEVFRYALAVQQNEIIDTSLFPFICTIPDEADIDDANVWKLSNPSLGTSFTEDDFRRDLERAKAGGAADLLSFRRYRLNQWCRAEDSFIDPVKFDRCLAPMTPQQLADKPLFVGVDLSQTTDPCSVSLCFALGERNYYLDNHAWVCEEGVKKREKTNLPKYRAFQADGNMTITSGSVNDYRKIKTFILELRNKYDLKEVVFDQYNAIEMASELMAEGITVYRQPQNHKHFTSPCKDFDVAISEERIKHDGNKLLRWALANTRLDYDSYGNCKPSRDKSTDKIDPAISSLMAFGRAVEAQVAGNRKSVYEDHGIFAL